MNRTLSYLTLSLGIIIPSCGASGEPVVDVSLTRLECGTPQAPTDLNARFSDTFAFPGVKLQFVYSCYVIRHGDEVMLWDTGQSTAAGAVAPKVGLVDLLAQL